MQATLIKTRSAQPVGQYVPNGIDAAKAAADFRIIACDKRSTIIWRDSRKVEHVTDRQLAKLQAAHTWACDF